MERPTHNMSNLFAQLGLAKDEAAIAYFSATHQPLAASRQRAVASGPFLAPLAGWISLRSHP